MGIDFAIGRPAPDYAATISAEVQPDEGRAALEAVALEAPEWEYLDDGPEGAHWAYGGFARFRKRVAELEGIELDKMWGFGPSNDIEAWMRMNPKGKIGNATEADWEDAAERWYEEVCVRWEDLDSRTPLEPFLHHSDCDGEMTPGECAQVAPRLRECVEKLAAENVAATQPGHLQDNDVINGRRLVAMMKFCAEHDHHLLFR